MPETAMGIRNLYPSVNDLLRLLLVGFLDLVGAPIRGNLFSIDSFGSLIEFFDFAIGFDDVDLLRLVSVFFSLNDEQS
jgi:hypothetical protein